MGPLVSAREPGRIPTVGGRDVLVGNVELLNQRGVETDDLAAAMADAEKAGKAAVTYDGMMIDYAHVRNALELLQQAETFGIEVGAYADVKAL